ncbi:MAG: hypothetical protein GY811_29650 [Myxococcales bacterium]|nr:hypothetical protein [Myxococcales bacterium]
MQKNAQDTQRAGVLVQTCSAAAKRGGEAMQQMRLVMLEIQAAAEGTADIVADLADLACEGDMLSLDAAVEAARAQGAGQAFAIVAKEVRRLASRTQQSAIETRRLINASMALAAKGGDMSEQVSRSLSEIIESVNEVTTIVSEISAANETQSVDIHEVSRAVADISRGVRESASLSEESSETANTLAGRSQMLASLVGGFKLIPKTYSKEELQD